MFPLTKLEVKAISDAPEARARRLIILRLAISTKVLGMSTPTPTGGQTTSFKTNVNRAKTKRWVEAKSYSYDGDDWGDVDDYDEYGGYDEYGRYNKPPPQPKPTGLRQRGQSASQMPEDYFGQETYQSPIAQDRPRGGSIGVPNPQQQYGSRNVTNPPSHHQPNSQMPGSFERVAERRAFSAGVPRQGASGGSNVKHSPIQQDQHMQPQDIPHQTRIPNRPLEPEISPVSPSVTMYDRRSMEDNPRFNGSVSSAGVSLYSATPQDQARVLSAGSRTQSIASNNSSLDFHSRRDFSPSAMPPPLQTRNSPSPSNDPRTHPPRKSSLSQLTQPSLPFDPQAPPLSTPIDHPSDVSQRDRAGSASSSTKPLPFVRPADIYKRIEEERERERQSQESSRPSMEAIMGKPKEQSNPDTRLDSDSASQLKPKLDPVSERKSEYGFEDLNVSDQLSGAERPRTTSKKFELKKPYQSASSEDPRLSSGMRLPDPTRVSGFGEGFGESFMGSDDAFGPSSGTSTWSPMKNGTQSTSEIPLQAKQEGNLQHQPSKGFTSVVHQAFDTAQEQVPPTPSSTANSSIGRSASGGTSTVSPIMSRGPSAIDKDRNDGLPSIDDVATPTQYEEDERLGTRNRSAGSFGTLTQASQSYAPQEDSSEMPPPGFVRGHRRNLSTPSPDNSPSRTPELASTRHLRQPQEVDLAETTPTPTESTSSASNSFRGSDFPSDLDPTYVDSPAAPSQPFPRQRNDSAGSGRVRNLADKFESNSRPGSAHSNSTPRASMLGSSAPIVDDLEPPRPINERMESFRPHLPGGWESSASIPITSAPDHLMHQQRNHTYQQNSASVEGEKVISQPEDEEPSGLTQVKETSSNPFSAAAEAGNALAGALVAAVGGEKNGAGKGEQSSKESTLTTRDRAASTNTIVHPEASRPQMPHLSDDESLAPTPLPKDTPHQSENGNPRSDYFGSAQPSLSAGRVVAKQPVSLPALSTDMQPQQYESDRLRREIARELSPGMPSEPSTAETDSPFQAPSRHPTDGSVASKTRESGVLPSEYDSYWNDNSDDASSTFSGDAGKVIDATTAQRQQGVAVVGKSLDPAHAQPNTAAEPAISQPLAHDNPHTLQHRFSWEQPLADLASPSKTVQESLPAAQENVKPSPSSDFLRSQIYPQGHPVPSQSETSQKIEPFQELKSGRVPDSIPDDLPKAEQVVPIEDKTVKEHLPDTKDQTKIMQSYPVSLEVVPPLAAKRSNESWEQQDAGSVSSSKHPSPAMHQHSLMEPVSQIATTPTQESPLPPPPPPSDTQPKLPAFREIMALKTPAERIRAFNENQAQFYNLNTGLAHWLTATISRLPEHGDIVINQGRTGVVGPGHKSSPSRSKLGGHMPGGGHTGQPYYQQYLDATPPSAGPGSAAQGGTVAQSSSQGFSPSGGPGGKISSQQVQAKSKELLHSAGVFGGKANIAAKGLFSKGKSKLRDASGSKKV